MPCGIIGLKSDNKPLEYGLVMQCDDTEVMGIKLQPPDCSREQVNAAMDTNISKGVLDIIISMQEAG